MLKRLPLTTPRKASGYRLITHASPKIVAALDEWISQQPEPRPTRAQAFGYALQDWLTGQGLLKHRDDPEGANGRDL